MVIDLIYLFCDKDNYINYVLEGPDELINKIELMKQTWVNICLANDQNDFLKIEDFINYLLTGNDGFQAIRFTRVDIGDLNND